MGAATAIDTFAHWSSTGDTWRDRPVLVYETGALMRRLIAGSLKNAGARNIIIATNRKEAHAAIEADLPGMVLADWEGGQTDHRSGLSLVRDIRGSDNPAYRDVPIVLTSQHATRTDVERARDSGISEFLRKPLSVKNLLTRVETAAMPRRFVKETRFSGPDRRRRPRNENAHRQPNFKRQRDVEDGLIDALSAARNACYALAVEVARDGCPHARRVSVSLKRYLTAVNEFGPSENEIVEMHRAALVQLEQSRSANAQVQLAVVNGLEEVVRMRLLKA
ncbi:response regulator [Hyphobacterium sp.]|uniref:response regulator n=1 Tax=Hyphobacterium sp. TaxID=2004662 RepID=UPI003BAC076C